MGMGGAIPGPGAAVGTAASRSLRVGMLNETSGEAKPDPWPWAWPVTMTPADE